MAKNIIKYKKDDYMKKHNVFINIFKYVCLIGYLLIAFLIIYESCLNGTKSSTQSNRIGKIALNITNGFLKDKSEEIKLKGLTIQNSETEVKIKETIKLNITFDPVNTTNKNVLYESSDESTAIVNEFGEIKFLKPGKVTIKAISGSINAEKEFIVINEEYISPPLEISFNVVGEHTYKNSDIEYIIIKNIPNKIDVLNSNYYKDISFTVDNEKILEVKGDGEIVDKRIGSSIVKIKYKDLENNEFEKEIKINVCKNTDIKNLPNFFLFIRKLVGHFGLFLVFGFFATFTAILWFKKDKFLLLLIINFVQGFIFASLSEFIQLFTGGRFGSIKDVLIDYSGFLIPVLIISTIFIIRLKKESCD